MRQHVPAAHAAHDEIAARLREWHLPALSYTIGVMAKYAAEVSSANEGAITRPAG